MPEKNPKVSYVVTVPRDRTEALAQFLREQETVFNPELQAVAFQESGGDTPMLMGYEIRELLPAVNDFLEENGATPRVPGNHEEWNVAQVHEFLELAVSHFNWYQGRGPTGAWWLYEGEPFAETAA